MNELQAIKVSDRIREEAPYLRERIEVHKLNHIEYVCRIKKASERHFYIWDMDNWLQVRSEFGVRERVEVEV